VLDIPESPAKRLSRTLRYDAYTAAPAAAEF